VIKDYFYTDEYGFMFDAIQFQMYGEGFKTNQPEMASILEDKQASGYLALEDLLKVSADNGFIQPYQKVFSIYAGDTAIMNEMTPEEQDSNIFTTKELGIDDRSYLSVGTFDSYLAYLLSDELDSQNGDSFDNLVNY
jgi:hypothetical protein